MSSLAEHDRWVREKPDCYTVFAFFGRGKRIKHVCLTLEKAREIARTIKTTQGRPVGIYAVRGMHQSHIENVQPEE